MQRVGEGEAEDRRVVSLHNGSARSSIFAHCIPLLGVSSENSSMVRCERE